MSETISIDLILNDAGMNRGYFEKDTIFKNKDFVTPIIAAYDDACEKAARTAKYAIRDGGMASLREAQWYEAVAATFEAILAGLPHQSNASGGDFSTLRMDIPFPPEFK